jgi:hypothetical protein
MFSPVCVWDGHPMLETCSERLDRLSCRLQLLLVRLWHHCRSSCCSERQLFTWRKVWWWHWCIWQRSWLRILIVFINRRRARTFLNRTPRTKQTTPKLSNKGVTTTHPMTSATAVFYVCWHLYRLPLKIALSAYPSIHPTLCMHGTNSGPTNFLQNFMLDNSKTNQPAI